MTEVTRILSRMESGDPAAAEQLLPLVYEELRRLAAQRLSHEPPGLTLDATALVHEAYLRLVGDSAESQWKGRGHFFGAAAEAMRRILVERARRQRRLKHGGQMTRVGLVDASEPTDELSQRVLEVDQALDRLAAEDPLAAEVVKLHYFVGLSLAEVGKLLGMSRATAYRQWAYARSWLKADIEKS